MTPMEEDLNNAIADVISKHENQGLVTKWVALIETINEHSERGMWTATSDDVTAWDIHGMLAHGLEIQKAQTFAHMLRDHGEEEE